MYPKVNSRASITQIFFLVFVPYITMMVPVTIIRSARGSYFRGKWEVRKGDSLDKAGKPLGPRRRTLPITLPIGCVTAGLLFIILVASNARALSPVAACAIGFGVTLVTTTILLPLYLARDMASFVSALSNPGRREPRPFLNYSLWEYIGPSIIFLGITSGTRVSADSPCYRKRQPLSDWQS